MIRISIDGQEVKAYSGQTILEAAAQHGISIPTLCHDERLKVYGGCGLCVVEVQSGGRLVRACATEVSPGMIVYTNSPRVQASRKMTLEFLLSDHIGDCVGPCTRACPAHTDVQGYVGLIANGQYREAVRLLKERLPIPASIGRVCPHPCETVCRRQFVEEPVAIANLKYFVADQDLLGPDPYMPEIKPPTGQVVAVVGAGPAGLTAAFYLAREGHQVDVFDAMPKGGGMLRYGIPEYRLPKSVLDQEIELIEKMGVNFLYNTRIGQDVSLDYLVKEYDAVFLGIGAWQSSSMRCKGEDLPGVIGGIDFLRQVAMNENVKIGQRVAIVGGGNTAMDAARTATRLGAGQVTVVYRRTRAEMPAEDIEIKEAEEEGVIFKYLVAPLEVTEENGSVNAIRLQVMELGEPDTSGRRSPVAKPGVEEILSVDTVISAIGQAVLPDGLEAAGLSRWGSLAADDKTMATRIPGVFAGGDGVTGPGIAIEAVAQGRRAAMSMIEYLKGREIGIDEPYLVEQPGINPEEFNCYEKASRTPMPHRKPADRRDNFYEVNLGLAEMDAQKEAQRCLECGCKDYFECRLIAYANDYKVQPERLSGEKRSERVIDEHPFILRNSQKCILCGLCVRICDEVMGVTALGLVGRGFESTIQPEFTMPLKETNCINCGQCVSVCPTGALLERDPIIKNLPMQLDETISVCTYCSFGCEQKVQSRGSMLVRVVPGDGEYLCQKGRFGFVCAEQDRVDVPLIRKNGLLVECSWEEALMTAAKKAISLKTLHSGDALAVVVSAEYTIGEAEAAVQLAREGLKTSNISSFMPDASRALESVFGESGSTNMFEEVFASDLVLVVGSLKESPITAVKIREAARQGTQLAVMSPESTLLDDLAGFKLTRSVDTGFIRQVLASLVQKPGYDKDKAAKTAHGFEELIVWTNGVMPEPEAERLAGIYSSAGKALIVIDGYTVTESAVKLLADMSIVAGKVGSPRNGIIVVGPGINQSGIWDRGVRSDARQIVYGLQNGDIKGIYVFGEDPVGAGMMPAPLLEKAELAVVITPYMTPTALAADVVLPGASCYESRGEIAIADRKVKQLAPAQLPPGGMDNRQLIERLAELLEIEIRPAYKAGEILGKPVKYESGFAFPDGKARIVIPENDRVFSEVPELNWVLRTFKQKLIQEGLS